MKMRLLLVTLAIAALLGGCVSSGYRTSHSVGVGYSHGRSSVGYGYQRGYPGSYGYGSQDYYRDRFYGSYGYGAPYGYGSYGYGTPYGYGSPSHYRNHGYRGYPYTVPRYRVIHPGNGYYGYPNSRPGYQGHGPNRPRSLPPRHDGRPPWRNVTPPPPVTRVTPPPTQPGDAVTPRAATPRDGVQRGLRRYKGGEVPPED